MNLISRSLLPLLVSALCAASCCAQAAPQNPPPLPKNPAALMQLAWQQNGLHGADLKPWHVRVTWQTVDRRGQPQQTGTWEEWWASPTEYKEEYETEGFHQTWWVTDHGDYVSGDRGWPAWIFSEIENIFTPQTQDLKKHDDLVRTWRKIGGARLQCLKNIDAPRGADFAYCLDVALPAIRVYTEPAVEAIVTTVLQFQGQFLPGDLRLFRLGMPDTEIHLDDAQELNQPPDSTFRPPSDASTAAPRRFVEADGLVPGLTLAHKPLPPPRDTHGRMLINAVISMSIIEAKDGSVSRVEVVGATPGLNQEPYLDFFKAERFRPSIYHGQPIAVRLQVALTFD